MTLRPGDTVDRYTVEDLIEDRAVTAVYCVRHAELDSRHLLHVVTSGSPEVRAGLRREWQTLAGLRHENVVSVTDLIEIDGAPAVVTESSGRTNLAEVLRQSTPPPAALDAIARGLIEGVRAAHAVGLAHFDLQPGRVHLVRRGASMVPRIADFGLVSVVMATRPDLRRSGRSRGGSKGVYLAPEQIRQVGTPDARADIFSLGAVLYELVTRQPAFVGRDRLDTFNRVSRGVFEPPRQVRPDLPDRIERAILGALVPDPDSRIPDARTLGRVWSGVVIDWQPARLAAARQRASRELTPEPPVSASPVPADDKPARAVRRLRGGDQPAPFEQVSPPPQTSAFPTLVPSEPSLLSEDSFSFPPLEAQERSTTEAPSERAALLASMPPTTDPPLPSVPAGEGVNGLRMVAVIAVVTMVLAAFWWFTQPTSVTVPPRTDDVAERVPPSPPASPPAVPEPAVVEDPVAVAHAAPSEAVPLPEAVPTPSTAPPSPPPVAAAAAVPPAEPTPTAAPPVPEAPAADPTPSPWDTPSTAAVQAEGGVRIWLVGAAGRFPPGDVPAGSYTVKAFFDPMSSVDAGTLSVRRGERWTVKCSKSMGVCSMAAR